MRRIITIIIALSAISALVWYIGFRDKPSGTSENPSGNFFQSFISRMTNPVTGEDFGVPVVVGDNSEDTDQESISAFKQIGVGPVAGYTVFTEQKSVSVPSTDPKQKPTIKIVVEHVIRYVSRSNGYVYEIRDGGNPVQISNVYVPNIYEAYFADGNKTVILRFLQEDGQTISTYSVPIPDKNPDGTRTQKPGIYFPENISSLAVSPDKKSVARLTHEPNASVISSSDTKNTLKKELARSSFHDWLLSWSGTSVYLQAKASSSAEGFLYRIDPTKRFIRVLGNINGLTTSVSPKGTYVLYSKSVADSLRTVLLATRTGVEKDLSLAILPEKCTWLQNEDLICAGNDFVAPANYPDDWYLGTTHFTDQIYRIYTGASVSDTLDEGSILYDATNLFADEERSLLYFIDKPTGILWQFSY